MHSNNDRGLRPRLRGLAAPMWRTVRSGWYLFRGRAPYAVGFWLRRPFARPRAVYFFPGTPPLYNATMCRILKLRGIRLVSGATGDRPLVSWDDTTVVTTPAPPGALNARCRDIRKSNVQRAFREAFGYDCVVDPLTYRGLIVEKSDANATHDGVLLAGPLAAVRPGKVYQRFLDNPVGAMVEEYRIPVVLGTIPQVYVCRKPPIFRFVIIAARARLARTSSILSAAEIAGITLFCGILGLDFGELDAIRDPADGRLYVIDANKTPTGPPRRMPLWMAIRAMFRLGNALDRLWLRPDRS